MNIAGPLGESALGHLARSGAKCVVFTLHLLLLDADAGLEAAIRTTAEVSGRRWSIERRATSSDILLEVRKAKPDVVILDAWSGSSPGATFLRKLVKACPETPAMVLASDGNPGPIVSALTSGAVACLAKPLESATLVQNVEAVRNGARLLCPVCIQAVVARLNAEGRELLPAPLSPRESQVMECLLRHRSDKEISTDLGIGIGTVHAHTAAIFEKLGAHSRGEAIRKFLFLVGTSQQPLALGTVTDWGWGSR